MTIFRTADPAEDMRVAARTLLADYPPAKYWELTKQRPSFRKMAEDDLYCAYESTMLVPVYQQGRPPYGPAEGCGYWDFAGACDDDASSTSCRLKKARDGPGLARARVVVTVPKAPLAASGPRRVKLPVVILSRTGAGGGKENAPLVDRSPTSLCHAGGASPTGGPARYFAAAGLAGISIDGPMTGNRTIANDPPYFTGEDNDIFNVFNMFAMRDNIRESALELVFAANIVDQLDIPVSQCGSVPGDAHVTLDGSRIALFSHSLGSSIAPLALATEPRFALAILSGAGGSWIENIRYKKMPQPLKPIFDLFTASSQSGAHDPVLSLLQWALEPADAAVYAPTVPRGPNGGVRHVLMIQGIVDDYIMPPIADSLSVPLGLDLVGAERDDCQNPPGDIDDATKARVCSAYDGIAPLSTYMPMAGMARLSAPVTANKKGATAVLFQINRRVASDYPCTKPDQGPDGHETIYEERTAQYAYRCFLESWIKNGTPTFPIEGQVHDPLDRCVFEAPTAGAGQAAPVARP
jgi:hypothetical protein